MTSIPSQIDFSAGSPIEVSPYPARLDPAFQKAWLERMLPEVVWIAALIWSRGPTRAARMTTALSKAGRHQGLDRFRLFAAASDYAEIDRDTRTSLIGAMEEKDHQQAVGSSLLPLAIVFPNFPLRFLCPQVDEDPDTIARTYGFVRELLDEFANPVTRSGLLLQGIVLLCAFQAGVLRAGDPGLLRRLGKIAEYPITLESCDVAVKVVELSTALFSQEQFFPIGDWPESFWRRIAELA